jgi:hypothetical protein
MVAAAGVTLITGKDITWIVAVVETVHPFKVPVTV